MRSCSVPFNVSRDIEFRFATAITHVADFPENWALGPGPVVHTSNTPGDTSIPIRFSPIELVPVVKINCHCQRLFRVIGPFEYLLCPVHTHIPMHFPAFHHFALGGIPEIVVRLCLFELFKRIGVCSFIELLT